MTTYRRESGTPLNLRIKIGGGGEGQIYTIVEDPRFVAKIYTTPTTEHSTKLAAMLARPPYDTARKQPHISLAWPTERVNDCNNRCVGFLMPYINHLNNFPLLRLYNPKDRLKTLPYFSWKYLLHAATNLASMMSVLHNNGYIVGDVNESNILVSKSALVTLVDCDSIQVTGGNGECYRCTVGKPEYTPQELQGRDFHSISREVHHDNFGLAVLIFQMLMEGVHPFNGVWQGVGDPPTLEQNIQAGNSPYLSKSILRPPPRALSFQALPQALQALIIRCFGEGLRNPSRRPTAYEWYQSLSIAEQQIVFCYRNSQHWYSQHLSSCPWCERIRQGIADPFPLHTQRATVSLTPSSTVRQLSPPQMYSSAYPGYGQQPLYPGPQAHVYAGSSYPAYSPSYPGYGQHRSSQAALICEVLLSIIGIFGVGWLLAGKERRGIILIICSFLFYWPFMLLLLLGNGATCCLLIALGVIIFNAVQLSGALSRRP